jgi:hypothetical protein
MYKIVSNNSALERKIVKDWLRMDNLCIEMIQWLETSHQLKVGFDQCCIISFSA